MGRHIAFFILFLAVALPSFSQRKGVIVSMETGVPIRDVKIYTNNGQIDSTNYRGEFQIKKDFSSITIAKASFVSLTLNHYEMTDTIQLLPKFNTLNEVIVWGKRKETTLNINRAIGDLTQYYTPKPGLNFDVISLFRRRQGLSKKEKQKHDEIIDTY
ncbi:hypothetical protein [Prevotella sp. HUN102]|uniref:hypothetical protein n=1 Tax=Prevotella sp. HUN102 TaxID=1392486 RepID=UPI000492036B|nr:hypothetical protein [Prevotella sp. HUN102]